MQNSIKQAVDPKDNQTVEVSSDLSQEPHPPHHSQPATGRYLALLSLSALGIVYGDIGTSPLYALRECFRGEHAVVPTPTNVLGVLSLIFWALILVVTVKYLIFVLQADNRGEGGILALTALATPIRALVKSQRRWLVILGVFGAALLYGDGAITPAISVLSAVEGLEVAAPLLASYVIPITLTILIGLFVIQSGGTARIGRLFGPVMLVWFSVLALLGILHIVGNFGVLRAINPLYAVRFFEENGGHGFFILGSVFLVVTGGEALYADMGHFGRRPIRFAWFTVVLPALLLNYFGQGALLLADPGATENSFYRMAPDWALYPLVVLATIATVIASQALISGAFSLTMQAIQLGFLPRLRILHTSSTEFGQIYIPAVNWALMATCIIIVLGFRTSSNLAAAYGIAVTSTMAITTLIFYIVAVERWHWNRLAASALAAFFGIIDLAFLGANAIKIPQGGWFPLVVAIIIFTVMTTWKRGRRLVAENNQDRTTTIEQLFERFQTKKPPRVPGTAIFLSANMSGAPSALIANIKYNGVLHEHVIMMTVQIADVSRIPEAKRIKVKALGDGIYRAIVTFGFIEEPNIPKVVEQMQLPDLEIDPERVTYFLNRTNVVASALPGMALWREKLFAMVSRNAASSVDFFDLPPSRVIEISRSVEV